MDLETPHGPARVHLQHAEKPRGALLLGHGAGGGVQAPDLRSAARAAADLGITAGLVEQPYRVAGRKSVPATHILDAGWTAVVEQLLEGELRGLRFVAAGRSSGARVACRTAGATGAAGVLCLAFPLLAPRRNGPPQSRQEELDSVTVPALVVQGENDRFGMPPEAEGRKVVQVAGDHGLKKDQPVIEAAVRDWLEGLF